jgi:hypothetical protein
MTPSRDAFRIAILLRHLAEREPKTAIVNSAGLQQSSAATAVAEP